MFIQQTWDVKYTKEVSIGLLICDRCSSRTVGLKAKSSFLKGFEGDGDAGLILIRAI